MGKKGSALQDHKRLDQFRWLQLYRSKHQPATGAVDSAAHYQGGCDQNDPNPQPQRSQVQPASQAGAQAEPEQPPASSHPNQLALEIKGAVTHLPFSYPPTGGGEHQ